MKNLERNTQEYEYYIFDKNDSIVRINDASSLEKFITKLKFTISFRNKHQIVGYRNESKKNFEKKDYKIVNTTNPRITDVYDDE